MNAAASAVVKSLPSGRGSFRLRASGAKTTAAAPNWVSKRSCGAAKRRPSKARVSLPSCQIRPAGTSRLGSATACRKKRRYHDPAGTPDGPAASPAGPVLASPASWAPVSRAGSSRASGGSNRRHNRSACSAGSVRTGALQAARASTNARTSSPAWASAVAAASALAPVSPATGDSGSGEAMAASGCTRACNHRPATPGHRMRPGDRWAAACPIQRRITASVPLSMKPRSRSGAVY